MRIGGGFLHLFRSEQTLSGADSVLPTVVVTMSLAERAPGEPVVGGLRWMMGKLYVRRSSHGC